MGDLRVNVTASKTKSVIVKANSVQTPISATPDLSLYYSDVAKDWAGKAEESANSAENSAISAENSVNRILNNEDVQAVIENLPAISAAPENAQIAQEQAGIATAQAVISTEQVTLATTQANLAKESAASAAENASIILEQTEAAQQAAVNANTSAVNADTSANSAREYMDNAEASAIAAKTSETNAKTSASEALASKNSANSSATSASTSATTATNKASEAKTSATQAANSATSAQSYAQEAKGYRDKAQEIADSMSGALNAYSKEETDALLDKKQDVLSANKPLEIGFETVGGPYNVNAIDGHLTPTYGGYPSVSRSSTSISLNVKSSNFPGFDDNNLVESAFKGECSYFDIPIDMATQMQKVDDGEQTKAEYEISVGGFQNTSNNIVFLAGNISDAGFEPIVYARPLNSTSSQYVLGLLDGTVSISSANTLKLNAYGSIKSAMTSGGSSALTPSCNLVLRYDISQSYPYYINTKRYTGSDWYVAYQRTNTDTVFIEKLRKINVVRVFWDTPYTSGNANTPSVDNTIVTLNSIDTGWRITNGAVTTYGVSLNYDNTLKVNDNGELGANLIAGENITIEDNVISAVVPEGSGGAGMPIGTIYPLNCSSSYVPEGSLPCDGAEYTKAQFEDLWNNYLTGSASKTYYSYGNYYVTSEVPKVGDTLYVLNDGELTIDGSAQIVSVEDGVIFITSAIIDPENPPSIINCYRNVDKDIVINGGLLNTCTYSEYEADLATYGQCAKFAVDTANETFRVPLVKDGAVIQQAMSDGELGKSYNAGLPNIESNFNATVGTSTNSTGAIKVDSTSNSAWWQGATNVARSGAYSLDASRSNSIYGNSDTVQPNAVALRYFVVVATGSINESMMDWSNWASNLQGKLNADHSNDTKPYIVEMSDESLLPAWYKVYSNGWCEQGGVSYGGTSNTGAQIMLLKPYKSADYSLLTSGVTRQTDGFSNASAITAKVRALANDSFYASTSWVSGSDYKYATYLFSWEAKGYIS